MAMKMIRINREEHERAVSYNVLVTIKSLEERDLLRKEGMNAKYGHRRALLPWISFLLLPNLSDSPAMGCRFRNAVLAAYRGDRFA